MRKRITSADVAMAAGVSKWTVIRAFEPGGRIAAPTREHVLNVARTLDYRPNLLARSLATRTTHSVAVLVDDFANPYKLPTLERLTAALQYEGRLVTLININQNYDHHQAITAARQRQFDAIVLFGTEFSDSMLPDLSGMSRELPIFVLARESTLDGVPYVTCDAPAAMAELCDHFVKQGYRRPGFLAGPQALSTALRRQESFRAFWQRRDVPLASEMAVARYDLSTAANSVSDYLERTPSELRCDLLMCENDVLALGALEALQGAEIDVPHGIAVAGFDDVDLAALKAFSLTSYRQPYEEMVAVLVDMLVGRRKHEGVKLRGRLMVRHTA